MFTHKDIQSKSIFIINGKEHQNLHVKSGFLHLYNTETDKTITKFPFPKILFLIVIGHTTITTALIEKCNKNKIPLVVMKPNFRSVYYFGNFAEANFLLRKKQYSQPENRFDIAYKLVRNKLENQLVLLNKTRKKDVYTKRAINIIQSSLMQIEDKKELRDLMALEGRVAKFYFAAYFQNLDWNGRSPKVKFDELNSCLDIGYTFLFNFIENMCRLFGFDLYVGVYHRLWFKRKSLVCDLIEPFRCIIDHTIRKSFSYGTFKKSDFCKINNAYRLKYGLNSKYTKVFYDAIIFHKLSIFHYVQSYYRAFMTDTKIENYPMFGY